MSGLRTSRGRGGTRDEGPHASSFLFRGYGHSRLRKTHSDIYRNQDKSKLVITTSTLEMLDLSVRIKKDAQNSPWASSSPGHLSGTVPNEV